MSHTGFSKPSRYEKNREDDACDSDDIPNTSSCCQWIGSAEDLPEMRFVDYKVRAIDKVLISTTYAGEVQLKQRTDESL